MTLQEVLLLGATAVGSAVGQWATRATLRRLLRAELKPLTVRVDALWVDFVRRAHEPGEPPHASA
jgi:hypothetical protein